MKFPNYKSKATVKAKNLHGHGYMEYVTLAPKVVAVAVEGAVGDWAAYISDVPGHSHEKEASLVAEKGMKLSKKQAEVIFPNWKNLEWRW